MYKCTLGLSSFAQQRSLLAVYQLQVLHFSDRNGMFHWAYQLLRPGGMFYATDFVQKTQLTEEEWNVRIEAKFDAI